MGTTTGGMQLFSVLGSVFIDDKDSSKKLDNINQKAEGVGGKLRNMIGTAAKWGKGIATAGAAAGAALFATATKAAAATDRVDKLSQKIGISRQSFQEWVKYNAPYVEQSA